MNKYFAMLAFAASAMMISSCTSSDGDEGVGEITKIKSFVVSSPSSGSRAVVSGDVNDESPKVHWEETDKINVWGSGATTKYVYHFTKHGNYKNYAAFEGTAFTAPKYYLMYPAQEGATFDGNGKITATIPTYQKARANSFDPDAAICSGATAGQTDTSVGLKHACAFFKITTVKDCQYVKVSPVGTSSTGEQWYMTGGINLTTSSSGSAITISEATGGVGYVVLNAEGKESCSTTFSAGTYLIAFASSTQFPGIKIEVLYADGTKAETTNSSTIDGVSFTSGGIYNLGTATPNQ